MRKSSKIYGLKLKKPLQPYSEKMRMFIVDSDLKIGVLLNAGPRPGGPRPTARGPRSTSRPAARRSTSRPAARGPPHGPRPGGPAAHLTARGPQIFGQWYIKAHAQIGIGECGRLWSKMDEGEFLVSSQFQSF